MSMTITKASDALKCNIRLAVVGTAIACAGCSPEGAGTIKIGNPEEVRSKVEGGANKAPVDSKRAQALQIEEEAAKKHPKLR